VPESSAVINLRNGLRGKGKPEPRTYAQPQLVPSLFQPGQQQGLGQQAPTAPCGECGKRKALGLPCCGRGR
jgi:hypothetical protein